MARGTPSRLGEALVGLRIRAGLKQKDLVQLSGLSKDDVSEIETGKRDPTREEVERLAGLMGFEPEDVGAMLFRVDSLEALPPGESPVSPTRSQRRLIRRGALATAQAGAVTFEAELTRRIEEQRSAEARKDAEEKLELLLKQEPKDWRYLVDKSPTYRRWAISERLALASEKAAAADAARALELADLAVYVAQRSTEGSDRWRARLEGNAWYFAGNARRVAGRLRFADEAFVTADELWENGAAADPGVFDQGLVLDLKASLRRDQRRFEEALALHERALKVTPADRQGYILLNKSKVLEELQDYDGALELLQRATTCLDYRCEPRLHFSGRFRLVVTLCRLGRYDEAEQLHGKLNEGAYRLGELDQVRLRWLSSWIASGQGRTGEAVAVLNWVRSEFARRAMDSDMALASLDLAVLYLEQGHTGKVKQLAREMSDVFKREQIHREGLAALKVFCEAALREAATVELAQRLRHYLQGARSTPASWFEG